MTSYYSKSTANEELGALFAADFVIEDCRLALQHKNIFRFYENKPSDRLTAAIVRID
jgi:hypothetical protein